MSKMASKKETDYQPNFKEHPRSYRLDSTVMNILKGTLARVNEVTPKKVSEAKLVKALIVLSKKIDTDEIVTALKEVW